MSTFDQRGQRVTYQYNAGGNINFGAVRNREEFARQLLELRKDVAAARRLDALPADKADIVERHLDDAAETARDPAANASSITKFLTDAKLLVETVTATAGLGDALGHAIELVRKLF